MNDFAELLSALWSHVRAALAPEGTTLWVVTILSGVLTVEEVVRRSYGPISSRIRRRMDPIRVARLEVVQLRRLEVERAYLKQLLVWIETRRWDPSKYVPVRYRMHERCAPPVAPILRFIQPGSLDEPGRQLNLNERLERLPTRRSANLFSELSHLRRLVLLGEPGAGKTTALLQLAAGTASRQLYETTKALLPVFIPLNEYTAQRGDAAGSPPEPVLDFIRGQLTARDDASKDLCNELPRLLREGRLLFIFDALDEMPRDDYYPRFRELARFMRSHDANLFIFSCRLLDYVDHPDFPVNQALLSPFSDREIKQLFQRYLGRQSKQALRSVFEDREYLDQIRSPFFLSLVSACVSANVKAGATWDVLLRNFVDVALDQARSSFGLRESEWQERREAALVWLSNLAFELVHSRATGTKADRSLVEATLEAHDTPDLLEIAVSAGILRRLGDSGDVRFEHHRLQEYFAARKLAKVFDAGALDLPLFVDDIWWREVIQLAAGLLHDPDDFIRDLLDQAEGTGGFSSRAVRVAFSRLVLAVASARPARHRLSANVLAMLRTRLLDYLRHGDMLQRVRLIRLASQFDDPRITQEIRGLLRDPSRWVRETALNSLLESAVSMPSVAKDVWQRLFQMLRGEQLLVQGLQDVPVLLRNRRTRWFAPLFAGLALLAVVRSSVVWLLISGALLWSAHTGRISWQSAITSALFVPALYGGTILLARRNLTGKAQYSFNALSLVAGAWMGLGYAFQRVGVFTESLKSFSGKASNFALGALWLGAMLVFSWRSFDSLTKLLAVITQRRRNRTVDPAAMVPQETLEGRTRQAEQLLRSARLDPDPVARRSLLNTIRRLLPVSDGFLDDLSEVIDQEPDLEVRECAWQVYEQVDLASGRDRPGVSQDAPRRRSAFISKRLEVENERQALKGGKRRP